MAAFRKRVEAIRKHLYERVDNDAKCFRFSAESDDMVHKKVKYLDKHIKNLIEQEKEKELPLCYGYLGIAYIKLKDFKKALEFLHLQEEMAVVHKDELQLRMAYGNLGYIYRQEWKLGPALDYYQKSFELASRQNNKYAQGRLYNNIANLFIIQSKYQLAIEQHKGHLKVATALNDRDGIIKSAGAIAMIYHALEDFPNAVSYLEQLMYQLRKNLKVLDTLADDASDSEGDDYIDIEEPDSENEEDGSSDDDDDGDDGFLASIKSKFGF